MSHVLLNKSFMPLLVSHFFSAINDSFMRTLFLFMATYGLTQAGEGFVIAGVILYALSFCAGSTIAGQVADKISKKKFLLSCRVIEVVALLLTLGGISLSSRWVLLAIMGGLGFIGACVRVADYSLMPSLVNEKGLVKANALIKVASLLGIGASALMLMAHVKFGVSLEWVCLSAMGLSCLGLLITCLLPSQNPAEPETKVVKNPLHVFDFISKELQYKFDDWAYLVGIAWFWVMMSLLGMLSSSYTQNILQARWSVVVFLSGVLFPVGYMIGSVICVRTTRKRLGSQAVWVGALMSVLLLVLAWTSSSLAAVPVAKSLTIFKLLTTHGGYWVVMADVVLLGVLSALYIIPFYSLLQMKNNPKVMGRLFSFSGLLNALFLAISFALIFALKLLSIHLTTIITFFAVVNLIISLYFARLLPLNQRRTFFKKALKKLFKVEVKGLENLPEKGQRCLIVANHTSFMDVLLVSAFVDRQIVFSINNKLLEKTIVKFMTNLVDLRPLDPVSPFAVKAMVEELRQNKTCMIFNGGLLEGGNTRLKIYEGSAMMALKGEAPVVPICIKGAAHTFGSRVLGKKAWFQCFPKITLTILPPVKFKYPDSMPTREQRMRSSSKLYDVIANMTFDSYDKNRTVFQAIADAMKMRGRLFRVLDDTARHAQTYASVFLKSFILGALMHKRLPKEQRVGLMMPTSAASVYAFLGLQAYGKTPAMINFTSGPKAVLSTCTTVGIHTVITAHKVVQLAKLEPLIDELTHNGIQVVYLEDLKSTLTLRDKVQGMMGALFPRFVYQKTAGKVNPKDTAVILFTSGSEGFPKAVFLSHENLLANCYQVYARFDLFRNDVFLNCLPLFHSFGLGAGTLVPMMLGVKTFLYPTPLHYRIIPEIAASIRATVFFATDTFLSAYARCANPYDFNSLRIVAGGAEKIKEETRKVWQEKFGVRLFEGYGATECSPFVAVNTFLHQRKDSVGRLLPRMEYRLKKVDGIAQGGELYLKGPNIMQGYMRSTDPGVLEPPKDGWYDTGDIVDIDEDGFIFIKGRCKRFAKIGGEMVSLTAVEQTIAKQWPEALLGAVNLPDEKKGEKIVLITTEPAITKDALIRLYKETGMTELGLPHTIVVVKEVPVLGTGKFDYQTAKQLAVEATTPKE